MKRTLAVIMAVLLMFSFAGCNKASSYKSGDEVSRRGPSVSAAEESEIRSEDETESESLFASLTDESSSEEESEPPVSSAEESSTASTASETSSKSDTKTKTVGDFSLTPKSVKDPSTVKMSDNLSDFTVEIAGKAYQLPMTVNDFLADGWSYEVEDGEEAAMDANSYLLLGADFQNKDGKLVRVDIVNYSNRKMKIDDCYITGFSYPTYGTSEDRAAVKFAKGIEVKKSKTDDVKSAYGDPTTYDTNSNSTTFNYKFNDSFYKSYTFTFDSDNVMTGFDVRNRVEVPDNFVQAPVSDVAPDYVGNYKAPTELGNELVSGKIQVDKVVYQLPCPLKAFIDDGWKIEDEKGEYESVDSNDYENIYLLKQGYEIEVKVENTTDLALPTEYCQVTYVYVFYSKVNGLEISLPGGVNLNSKTADLQKVMKNDDNDDTYKAYRNDKEDDYEHYVTVYYDNDNDKVLSIVLNFGVEDNS